MQRIIKKSKVWGVFLFAMLLAVSLGLQISQKNVKAATNGFVTVDGKTYYYQNGQKYKGWLTLNGKKYYFYTVSGEMAKGWVKNSSGQYRFFNTNTGAMVTGWCKNTAGQYRYFNPGSGIMAMGWAVNSAGQKRYFNTSTGYMLTGWGKNAEGKYRYFNTSTGYMLTGWGKNSAGKYRYFNTSTGYMLTGFVKNSAGEYRYFDTSTGYMATGWLTSSNGKKRYFNPADGIMFTGIHTIGNKDYEFDEQGYMVAELDSVNITQPTSARTIKNYLAGALQPVGRALYVWGGGWTDATRKGVNPNWKAWYDSQTSSYDYNNYRDLSASTRSKGLDCSGFVGWAAYQVMQTTSGIGSGYTVVSGDVGSSYAARGWGSIVKQSDLAADNWTLKPGDVGYNSGHTWIVIGQCSDKSVVIVHSTPNAGCQIAGTPTPSGNYSSQAIALAKQYMQKYPGFSKYNYHTSSGNYVRNGDYLRWNRVTLADPDGYMNKTADQILADLFS